MAGLTLSTVPLITSKVSNPVIPNTPGAIPQTGRITGKMGIYSRAEIPYQLWTFQTVVGMGIGNSQQSGINSILSIHVFYAR
jgi:hypothetical protein